MSAQARVAAWVRKVFDETVAVNAPERTLRFVEEAVELAQAVGIDARTMHRLVDYVFSRPVGEAPQEVAGSLVTLYAAASALGIDADTVFETELARIDRPEVIERVRRRQAEKREALVTRDTSEDEFVCPCCGDSLLLVFRTEKGTCDACAIATMGVDLGAD